MSENRDAKDAWVERVLGYSVAAAAATARPNGAAVRLTKGLLLWNNTRGYVSRQIKTLQQAILADMQDEPDFDDIKANLGNLEEMLEVLDDSLADKLGELHATADPARKAVLSGEARAIVTRFQQYVANDGLVNEIDDNGFVSLDIKPKVSAALAEILQMI
jgi:hypothetical protein